MRVNLYQATFIKILLLFLFFSITRILFYFYNQSYFPDINFSSFTYMLLGGLRFDLTAIIYLNALFIIGNFIPFDFRLNKKYQQVMKYFYIITNSIGLAFNFLDFEYYPFILKRTTASVFTFISGESNKTELFQDFFLDFWPTILLFLTTIICLYYCYSKIEIGGIWSKSELERNLKDSPIQIGASLIGGKVNQNQLKQNRLKQYGLEILIFMVVLGLSIGGIRGGFTGATRPITLSNAGAYVNRPQEMAIVLNTPFAIMRTLGKKALKPLNYFDENAEALKLFSPYKNSLSKKGEISIDSTEVALNKSVEIKNVVIFILESFGKESFGFYNKHLNGGKYKGYTPFLDSLAEKSWTFNSFANGRKSIDGLPAVIASIPAFNKPYILSQHSGNEFDGLGEMLKSKGFSTAFFHGAADGSMGFDAFVKLAGYDQYFGRTAYSNDNDFDGTWGIWDEPFLQFQLEEMKKIRPPFLTTTFTLSSHHPFKIPSQYEGKFPKGTEEIHQGIGYTDYAMKRFFKRASLEPWFEETLFVITNDHTNQNSFEEYRTSKGLMEGPIMFFHPSGELAKQEEDIAQQIDITPTILSLLDFKDPYFSFGNDLTDPKSPRFAISAIGNGYQLVQNDFVMHFDLNKVTGFYNFKVDPLLKNNLVEAHSEEQQKMEIFIKGYIQQFHEGISQNKMSIYNQK